MADQFTRVIEVSTPAPELLEGATTTSGGNELAPRELRGVLTVEEEGEAESKEGLDSVRAQDPAGVGSTDDPIRVYLQDIGSRLIKQEIGNITKEIQELRKAGALMDNTRIRGMVGFVTNPVGTDTADRARGTR